MRCVAAQSRRYPAGGCCTFIGVRQSAFCLSVSSRGLRETCGLRCLSRHAAESSCSDLDHRIKVDLPLATARHYRSEPRPRRLETISAHATEMELYGRLNTAKCGVNCLARCHTAGEVGDGCPPVTVRIFVDAYQILQSFHAHHRFKPACRLTDAKVPFGMSSPRFPLTVTRPDLPGCLNCP